MSTHLVAVLTTLFTLTATSFSSEILCGGDTKARLRAGGQACADERAASGFDEPRAPMMLALELGRLGDDGVPQQDRRRVGTSERVFGPVHPTSRLGTYTGRNLGSYTGRGLGSYTGSGLGGASTMGIGNANGTGTGAQGGNLR